MPGHTADASGDTATTLQIVHRRNKKHAEAAIRGTKDVLALAEALIVDALNKSVKLFQEMPVLDHDTHNAKEIHQMVLDNVCHKILEIGDDLAEAHQSVRDEVDRGEA